MKIVRSAFLIALVSLMFVGMASATNVTFQVNMNYVDTSSVYTWDKTTDGVVIRGTMNGWAGNDLALADGDGDGIFTGTFDLAAGNYEFKYALTFAAGGDQWEGGSAQNRPLQVGGTDMTARMTWFDFARPAGGAIYTTIGINMNYQMTLGTFNPETDALVLAGTGDGATAGDYLDWSPDATANPVFADPDSDGVYWVTIEFPEDNWQYKATIMHGGIPSSDLMWENNYNGGAPTSLVLDASTPGEVIEAVRYWDGAEPPSDFAQITFNVDMSTMISAGLFTATGTDPDTVFVGGEWVGSDWIVGRDSVLTDDNADGVYTGTFTLPVPVAPDTVLDYKFAIEYNDSTVRWETDVRHLTVKTTDPIDVPAVYFNNITPDIQLVDINVLFQVDMSIAETNEHAFDPDVDHVVLRGNQFELGDFGGYKNIMTRQTGTQIYAIALTLKGIAVGTEVQYKFVIDPGGDGEGNDIWEQPVDDIKDGNRYFDVPDQATLALPVVYFDDNVGGLANDMTLTLQVDARPAYYKLADVGIDGVTSIDVISVHGAFRSSDWDWGNSNADFEANDDGITGDAVAGDSIWTWRHTFPANTALNFTYKYGINNLDNEAGFSQNHFVRFDMNSTDTTVVDTFGSQGDLYTDYIDMLLSVREIGDVAVPNKFTLNQNYPNPFNPTTTIAFNLPQAGKTMLHVYNVMGQEVAQMDLGRMNAGAFEVTLDGSQLASGVYFYRLDSGQFTATRKMMLLK